MNNGHGEPAVVTAGEISRNFGQWQDRALGGPVILTHHGRPRVVLISADHYSAWREDGSHPAKDDDQPSYETSQHAILDHVSEAFMALDAQLRIRAVNHVFEALVGRSASQIVGHDWEELFPPAARTLMGEQLRRALRTGEALDFEAPGDGSGVRRYAIRAFPYPGGVAALIQHRTAEREMQARLHEAKALDAALSMLSQVMVLRLNVRGVLTSVDERFAGLLGVATDELLTSRLPDIAGQRRRSDLAASVEAVLRGGPPTQVLTTLIAKDGRDLPVRIGLAGVVNDLAPDGLVAAVTLIDRGA